MVGAREDEARGGGENVALRGGVFDSTGTNASRELAWLLLINGDGDRQLPNKASWKADAVGEGWEYSDSDGRPSVWRETDNEGRGITSSISPCGVEYERPSSSEYCDSVVV